MKERKLAQEKSIVAQNLYQNILRWNQTKETCLFSVGKFPKQEDIGIFWQSLRVGAVT